MSEFLLKTAVSALLVAAAAEIARRSTIAGALLASLPLTSILAMIWLWRDGAGAERIAGFGSAIFWLVLPSLLLFVVTPALLRAGGGFWPSVGAGCTATTLGYLAGIGALRWWNAA